LEIVLDQLRRRFLLDGHKLKHLRFDEQFSTEPTKDFLASHGITYDVVPPYEHSLLGLVERANRSLEEKLIKVMDRVRDKRLWGMAVADCVLKMNLCPRAALDFNNPYEQWFKKKFDMSTHPLLPFGVKVMAHVPVENQHVLGPKAVETIAVGTREDALDTVQLWQPKTHKIWNRRTFKVIEEDPYDKLPPLVFNSMLESNHEIKEFVPEDNLRNTDELNKPGNLIDNFIPRRSNRLASKVLEAPIQSDSYVGLAESSKINIPRNIFEAKRDLNYGVQWIEAMHHEIRSLFDQQTFEFIGIIPPRQLTVPSMFVFDIRYNPDGSIKKFKCRLVARGDKQNLSTFTDTFADTVSSRSINLILSLAAIFDMELQSIDIKTAFLYSPVKEEIYIQRPPGINDDIMPPFMKLKKCLYGLKQAAHEWKAHVYKSFISIGFQQCKTDECVYIRRHNEDVIILAIHVDDILVASSSEKLRLWFNTELVKIYEITVNHPLDSYLGMSISRDRANKTIQVSQPGYIDRMIESYDFGCYSDPNPITPMAVEHEFDLQVDSKSRPLSSIEMDDYMSKVGAVQYLTIKTRPDLTYAIGRCAMHLKDASENDMKAINRILRYIYHTKDIPLQFGGIVEGKLLSFVDASYASHSDRKSHYGISIHYGASSGSIHTISKRTKVVALSSTEAEYIGLCEAAKVVAWARQFLAELGFEQNSPAVLFEDNQSAISMVNNGNDHGRTKHIDIRYHYIRDLVKSGQIDVKYLDTDNMVADTLTKALDKKKFLKFRNNIMGFNLD
jgi:hypothetical protein